ncbi:unnamed protein product [Amoebophrya sp. A120]|nr:unnamed protein product [Amoebophrya sp. A120]|eukprot:GSA120T00007305001.1
MAQSVMSPMVKNSPMATAESFNSMMPTGLKGKLASLEDFISMQNEELAAQRQEIESLRNDKQNIEQHYQAQLQELKKTMVADVQRMQDEVKRHFAQQRADNARLQQQITTLKGEKTSLMKKRNCLQTLISHAEVYFRTEIYCTHATTCDGLRLPEHTDKATI